MDKSQPLPVLAADGGMPLNPYYPLGVVIPGYVPNDMSTLLILGYFGVGCGTIMLTAYLFSRRSRPSLPNSELATVVWFVLSGCIHLGMEGYVVYHFDHIASMKTVLGQAWKEYSHSDSRYLTQDTFVITMEAITAIFWGPLSLVVAYCIVANHPLRHPLQSIVSLGQFYGDVLYYATCAFDHIFWETIYCRPENYYFWFYFIFFNAFWIVIPLHLLVQSVTETKRAFVKVSTLERGMKKG